MPFAFRLVKTRYADTAFSGEGARLYGGRWNSRGQRVSYAADSISLAALELLVHLRAEEILGAYTLFRVALEDSQIMTLAYEALPKEWQAEPAPRSAALIGDAWVAEAPSIALRVPSVIVHEEYNVLLNPNHPDYTRLTSQATSRPFQFDQRLAPA